MRRPLAVLSAAAAVVGAMPLASVVTSAHAADAAGTLSPVISQGARPECLTAKYQPTDGYRCPPAAMAAAVLPTGKVLFWDGLEGMNRVQLNTVAEFGDVAQDDQSRVATFGTDTATFTTPANETGAPTDGHGDDANQLVPGSANDN